MPVTSEFPVGRRARGRRRHRVCGLAPFRAQVVLVDEELDWHCCVDGNPRLVGTLAHLASGPCSRTTSSNVRRSRPDRRDEDTFFAQGSEGCFPSRARPIVPSGADRPACRRLPTRPERRLGAQPKRRPGGQKGAHNVQPTVVQTATNRCRVEDMLGGPRRCRSGAPATLRPWSFCRGARCMGARADS
jgi:hypothetical protein